MAHGLSCSAACGIFPNPGLKPVSPALAGGFFFFFFINRLFFFLRNSFIYLFIYFWLCWVFVSVRGLSPVAASGGHSSSRRAGLSPSRPLLLRSTGSRRAGSVAVAHGLNCSAACGILPDQGSNPCPLHWQADPQPLRHQGSPGRRILNHCTQGNPQGNFLPFFFFFFYLIFFKVSYQPLS